jgi:1-acyl-sn-glycerol-3-phosphate acyltransferase
VDERVRRRGEQQDAAAAVQVAAAIAARDERDKPQSGIAQDAITIDTTGLGIDESLTLLVQTWLDRRGELLNHEEVGGRTAQQWIENDFDEKFDRTLKLTHLLWEKGFRLQSHGVERVPKGGCLFIANHSSMWDSAFVIAPLGRPIRYMAKRELVTTPLVKDLGDSIGMFPVRRGAGDRVAMHIGESILRRGDSLGIFPEGTRVYEGTLSRPRAGAARLALVAGVPVVPVAIYGNRWRESLFRVSVAYGKPHYFTGQRATPANVVRATEQVWADVVELWHALKNERRW